MGKKVAVRYIGGGTERVIELYRWNARNGYVQKVPVSLAADLLTYPRADFELVDAADGTKIEAALKREED